MPAVVLCAVMSSPSSASGQARTQPGPESPNRFSSADLVERPGELDGTRIEFSGEAIGEAMVRGGMSWLHVNDDAYHLRNIEEGAELGGYNSGMPVWLPSGEAGRVAFFGDFRHQGDVVSVRGTFNAACLEHGGDMDIHADALSVVARGRRVEDRVSPRKVSVALVLTALAAGLWALDGKLAERTPKVASARQA